MTPKHVIYTPGLMAQAFEAARPKIGEIMRRNKGFKGYLIALPPLVPEPKYMASERLANLAEEIGFQFDFGGRSDEHPYDTVALAKLLSVYVWQMSSREVRDQHLVLEGMSRWAGGIGGTVVKDPFKRLPLVAYSGQPEDVDEEIARIYLTELLELAQSYEYSEDPSHYAVTQKETVEAST